jgi:hypothetical protein
MSHILTTRARVHPAMRSPLAEDNPSDRLLSITPISSATLMPPCSTVSSQYEGLGYPIEYRSQHDRERRALGLRATGVLAVSAAASVEPPVSERERRRSDQCVGTNGRDFARLQRLIDELEGNRPDQEAGTQRHHDRDELLARHHRVRDERSDEEGGGGERTPEEGLDHGWRLTGRRDGTREVVLRERSGPWSRLTQR